MKQENSQHFYIDNLITRNAQKSLEKSFSKENWDEWVKCWFEEAEKLKNQFSEEGLQKSAEYVQQTIDFNKKLNLKL